MQHNADPSKGLTSRRSFMRKGLLYTCFSHFASQKDVDEALAALYLMRQERV